MIELMEEGYEDVRLTDASGSVVFETRIDLWDVYNRMVTLQNKHKGQPAHEFYAGIVDYLQELGFPPVSHHFAGRFYEGLYAKVNALKNSPEGENSHVSPASTD